MDIRVLKYFMKVAETNNITRAAEQLHVTQPTLSRQIMDLEKELGVQLFDRQHRQMSLNQAGLLFHQKVTTLLALLEQAENELHQQENNLTGIISLGIVETGVGKYMMDMVAKFREEHPGVQFALFDGDGDSLCERLDQGLADIAVLVEPVEAAKYNYIRLPVKEEWGIIMQKDDPLAQRDVLTREDLYKLPLIMGRRGIMRDSVSDVLKLDQTKLHIPITVNLPLVSRDLIVNHHYYHLGIRGVYEMYKDPELVFVPFSPRKTSGHILAWRKNIILSPAVEKFLQQLGM
jgi:DNA-binding transcriptional LysR family regulator